MSWELLWKIILLFTLVGYSALVVVVLFGGIGDIKNMFKDLKSNSDESS